MSEYLLFAAQSESKVKAITLQEFGAVFGTDRTAWGALDVALFRMQKVVRFTHASENFYWIGPFNENEVGIDRRAWAYNYVDFDELSEGAHAIRVENRKELAVQQRRQVAPVLREYRLNFTAHPPLYASAIVKAASPSDAEHIGRTNFPEIRYCLHETAENAFKSWEPEPHHFHFEHVEAVND